MLIPLTSTQNEEIDFTSAFLLEASVAPELSQANLTSPVPLPADAPGYESILRLAAAMPALPVTVGEIDVNEIIAEITPPANNNNNDPESQNEGAQLDARQNALRVLVVGDSMTHCNEGDFTWRYRLLEWFNAQNVAFRYVGPYSGTIAPGQPAPPPKPPLYNKAVPPSPPNVGGGYASAVGSVSM